MKARSLTDRADELIYEWDVIQERSLETESSLMVFGTRGDQAVVLKVLRESGDVWRCGEVLEAFEGRGVVRCYERVDGAVLVERLIPGNSLAELALGGDDDKATEILAEVIQRMAHPRESVESLRTVANWGEAFDRYLESDDQQVSRSLVEQAGQMYTELCGSQKLTKVLHGDLHHYNILCDTERGWLAIDPKGVVGEIEYELGASLRNPYERPELFASVKTVARRLKRFEADLKVDSNRALRWAFAQSVLSAIWSVEDGWAVGDSNPALMLANTIRSMLD